MREPTNQTTRRSFLEKVAAATGLSLAGGGLLNTLNDTPAMGATSPSPTATDFMNQGAFGWPLTSDTVSATAPTLPSKPNILMIMVDQLRLPEFWTTPAQQASIYNTYCPNIGNLRKCSSRFWNFYIAAQNCTPSRATLLTGLYAPQTGVLATEVGGSTLTNLNPGFPTFGSALHDIAQLDTNDILWFGKWHLSDFPQGNGNVVEDTLPNYGFNAGRATSRTLPIKWPSTYGSPNGSANQGTNGAAVPQTGASSNGYPSDAAIAADFTSFWSTYTPAGTQSFACVSFINPHDIAFYPGFFPHYPNDPFPYEPSDPTKQGTFYNPNAQTPTAPPDAEFVPHGDLAGIGLNFNWTPPNNWNYEFPGQLGAKSADVTGQRTDPSNFLQVYFQTDISDADYNIPYSQGGGVLHAPILQQSDYDNFFNWYFYLLQLTDTQIGNVLNAVFGANGLSLGNPASKNTAVIFLSDHGDYAGSHGLHSKGGAVYDEALRVPFYVSVPGQVTAYDDFHMCSMVDVFKFVVELALGGTYNWAADGRYKDQALNQNQSLWSFLQTPSMNETRTFQRADGTQEAYILTTTDETYLDKIPWASGSAPKINPNCNLRSHVMCIRTKSDSDHSSTSAYTGAKLALYSQWVGSPRDTNSPIVDGTVSFTQDYEYYDYANYLNRTELGNNYFRALNDTGAAKTLLTDILNAFGNMRMDTGSSQYQAASGLVLSILTRMLQGSYKGTLISTLTGPAISNWYRYAKGALSSCIDV